MVLIVTDLSPSFALMIRLLNIGINHLTVCWLHPSDKVALSLESCEVLSKAPFMSMIFPRAISLVVIDFYICVTRLLSTVVVDLLFWYANCLECSGAKISTSLLTYLSRAFSMPFKTKNVRLIGPYDLGWTLDPPPPFGIKTTLVLLHSFGMYPRVKFIIYKVHGGAGEIPSPPAAL